MRGIPAGNLQTIIFYLDVLHSLHELGICVYNNASMIEKAVDKTRTSFTLRRLGIPTPKTWSLLNTKRASKICEEEINKGIKLVLKPTFGSQGNGLYLVSNEYPLPDYFDDEVAYYLQEFIVGKHKKCIDVRVLVIGQEANFVMQRVGQSWINNISKGGIARPYILHESIKQVARDAVQAIGLFYAGVDIIIDDYGGCSVIEINSIPAWKGLQSVSDTNISDCIIEAFLAQAKLLNSH